VQQQHYFFYIATFHSTVIHCCDLYVSTDGERERSGEFCRRGRSLWLVRVDHAWTLLLLPQIEEEDIEIPGEVSRR